MPTLTIGWEYLTGYAVATDPASRNRAEWPPHPGRIFMALAAAWFETGEDPAEGDALRWLESLGDPTMVLPPKENVFERDVVTFNVPINADDFKDIAPHFKKDGKWKFHTRPTELLLKRLHVERTFPCVWTGNEHCFMQWPNATDFDFYRPALEELCGKVTRIGHSSSLVSMWLGEVGSTDGRTETWVPDDVMAEFQARRVSSGTLSMLDRQFNRHGREQYEKLSDKIATLTAMKKGIKGSGAKERKAAIDVDISRLGEQLKSLDPRPPHRPTLGLWTGYRRSESKSESEMAHTDFDSDILILKQVDGPRLPLASTLAVTQALRGAVMRQCGVQPPPSWVSGHLDDCQPLRNGNQHLAYIPLPFVSSDYADGHLLGVALIFPRSVPRSERGRALGQMFLEPSGQPRPIDLTLGHLGVWKVIKRDWSETRHALKPETWTAHPNGWTRWASITPVVLDRFPKADWTNDRMAWEIEVAGIITRACQRIGLPEPAEIDIGTTSWHRGSPRAYSKRRPLRGHETLGAETAPLGDGFPPYPTKGSSGPRLQLHVYLRFSETVVGPILLCAGRFLGYGLCKPLQGGAN